MAKVRELSRPIEIPAHVPIELVRSVNLLNGPGIESSPHAVVARLHEDLRTFYNVGDPFREPSWVPTKAEDQRAILQNPEVFSSRGVSGFSALIGESWPLIPTETDPPVHSAYRALLNPLFSPKRISAMEIRLRERAAGLVGDLRGQTGCEFMTAFGRAFPIHVFLQLMGLPTDKVELFYGWIHGVLHAPELETRSQAMAEVAKYLRSVAAERLGDPRDDVISFVVNARIDGKPLTEDEVIGMLTLIFGGGIDTVANTLGFIFLHLARDPELQSRLRNELALIPQAVEELLRAYGIVLATRLVTRDVEAAGVQMKAGDWVHMVLPAGNLDPAEFPNPTKVNIERENFRHMTFSFGPHRCLGSHLARREFAIALEAFFAGLPPFRLADGRAFRCHGGLFGVDYLDLVWRD